MLQYQQFSIYVKDNTARAYGETVRTKIYDGETVEESVKQCKLGIWEIIANQQFSSVFLLDKDKHIIYENIPCQQFFKELELLEGWELKEGEILIKCNYQDKPVQIKLLAKEEDVCWVVKIVNFYTTHLEPKAYQPTT